MNRKTGWKIPGYLALAVITLVAGIALGATYSLTEAKIAEQAVVAAENARRDVMKDADAFEMMDVPQDAQVDWCYEAKSGGNTIGYVAQTSVNGFAGPIEVIAGVRLDGEISGVSVGGSSFKETAGLGEKTKQPAFTGQFSGKNAPLRVIKAGEARAEDTVDAVTSATVSSKAVTGGVNSIAGYVDMLLGNEAEASSHATQEAGGTEG